MTSLVVQGSPTLRAHCCVSARIAASAKEEIFHLSSTDWTQKSTLQDKLNWVIRAGLEDLDDPDYMVGGERCSSVLHRVFHVSVWSPTTRDLSP